MVVGPDSQAAVGGQKSDQALQIDFCPPTPDETKRVTEAIISLFGSRSASVTW
jgi:hypothetical protein